LWIVIDQPARHDQVARHQVGNRLRSGAQFCPRVSWQLGPRDVLVDDGLGNLRQPTRPLFVARPLRTTRPAGLRSARFAATATLTVITRPPTTRLRIARLGSTRLGTTRLGTTRLGTAFAVRPRPTVSPRRRPALSILAGRRGISGRPACPLGSWASASSVRAIAAAAIRVGTLGPRAALAGAILAAGPVAGVVAATALARRATPAGAPASTATIGPTARWPA
jgi:hypothetical protein